VKTALGVTLLLLLSVPAARAQDRWTGAFKGGFSFFVGGGVGGGLSRTRFDHEEQSRYAAVLPLTLRAGFDFGRYGLAVLIDTQYSFLWGPAADQGPRPMNRSGRFEMLSISGEVLWRAVGPLFVMLGAGGALTASDQDMFTDPVSARAELVAGIGFLYRMPRKDARYRFWPFGMSLSVESRYYLPWREDFMNYSVLAVLTFYFVFGTS
jgi:hypothetical protein